MVNITVEQFRARFKEFRDTEVYPDAVIELLILDSANEVAFDKFGASGPKAQAYYVAFWLKMNTMAEQASEEGGVGLAQRIASESEGDTSVTYQLPDPNDGNAWENLYNTNGYGQIYWAMAKYAVGGVTSTGVVRFPMPYPNPWGNGPFGIR